MRSVRKEFPGTVALRDVDFEVAQGEVRALVGENGAGKSTLIKIIAGAITHDSGTVEIAGVGTARPSPALSAALGVSVIHQERQIAGDVSVAENVLLGRLPTRRWGAVDWPEAYRQARGLLARVGLDVDVRRPAGGLSIAEQQELEVARALVADAKLVIMDEPTASLSRTEIERLFAIIRRLRDAGQTVLYISHHLEEIFDIADTVTVLRDGAIVVTEPTAALDADRLTNLMFGRNVARLGERLAATQQTPADVVLDVRGLRLPPALGHVDLALRRGEVLCVTGGIGSGRRELARCLVGALTPAEGEVVVSGRGAVRSPRHALRYGIGFVPEDRKREGVLLELDLIENVDLARLALARNPLVNRRRRRRRALELARSLRVRFGHPASPVKQLSGGNQQKVLLARLLNVDAQILVFDEPTAGVDVGTKLEIYDLLRSLAARGTAVLVFSSDNEEIKLLANRVLVLSRGRVVGELDGADFTKEHLLALEMAG
jgi:ABC-type sugar transport system ATPase subunit